MTLENSQYHEQTDQLEKEADALKKALRAEPQDEAEVKERLSNFLDEMNRAYEQGGEETQQRIEEIMMQLVAIMRDKSPQLYEQFCEGFCEGLDQAIDRRGGQDNLTRFNDQLRNMSRENFAEYVGNMEIPKELHLRVKQLHLLSVLFDAFGSEIAKGGNTTFMWLSRAAVDTRDWVMGNEGPSAYDKAALAFKKRAVWLQTEAPGIVLANPDKTLRELFPDLLEIIETPAGTEKEDRTPNGRPVKDGRPWLIQRLVSGIRFDDLSSEAEYNDQLARTINRLREMGGAEHRGRAEELAMSVIGENMQKGVEIEADLMTEEEENRFRNLTLIEVYNSVDLSQKAAELGVSVSTVRDIMENVVVEILLEKELYSRAQQKPPPGLSPEQMTVWHQYNDMMGGTWFDGNLSDATIATMQLLVTELALTALCSYVAAPMMLARIGAYTARAGALVRESRALALVRANIGASNAEALLGAGIGETILGAGVSATLYSSTVVARHLEDIEVSAGGSMSAWAVEAAVSLGAQGLLAKAPIPTQAKRAAGRKALELAASIGIGSEAVHGYVDPNKDLGPEGRFLIKLLQEGNTVAALEFTKAALRSGSFHGDTQLIIDIFGQNLYGQSLASQGVRVPKDPSRDA